jgi:D-serine deaminase-like pyridoxal phosphate-dependent protein
MQQGKTFSLRPLNHCALQRVLQTTARQQNHAPSMHVQAWAQDRPLEEVILTATQTMFMTQG